jgi:A/G-specific adenine glycosylase
VSCGSKSGIWAGLHCLPVFDSEEALNATLPEPGHAASRLPGFLHVLTHKDLHLHPVKVVLDHLDCPGEWVHQDRWTALGLPAPVRKLLTAS